MLEHEFQHDTAQITQYFNPALEQDSITKEETCSLGARKMREFTENIVNIRLNANEEKLSGNIKN